MVRLSGSRGLSFVSLASRLEWFGPSGALAAALVLAVAGCDSGAAPAKDEKPKAQKKPAEPPKTEEPVADKKPDPTAPPWQDIQVKNALKPGLKLEYKRTGTNAKGKAVDDKQIWVLRATADEGISTSYTIEPDPGTNKSTSLVAVTPWTALSPFFALERPKVTISGRESLTVPAGSFEVSVATLDDVFGASRGVWMIVDKPGIYAKVTEKANAMDEGNKTDLTYELVAITEPE